MLHHQFDDPTGDRGDHFDFMLSPPEFGPEDSSVSRGELLWTWAIHTNPLDQSLPLKCSAERLPDHRVAYLEYEGPISGDRGRVQQVAKGTYEAANWSEEQIELRLLCSFTLSTHHEEAFWVSLNQQGGVWELNWSVGSSAQK